MGLRTYDIVLADVSYHDGSGSKIRPVFILSINTGLINFLED